MNHIVNIIIAGLLLTILGCRAQKNIVDSGEDTIPVLCGKFVATEDALTASTIEFKGWKEAVFTTSIDEMLQSIADSLAYDAVRPPSSYFISNDTVYIEVDKGHLTYKIKDQNTLIGAGFWNDGNKLVRENLEIEGCEELHTLSPADKSWIRQSKLYFKAYTGTDFQTSTAIYEKLCEEGYGSACMSLGMIKLLRDKEEGIALLEKACEIGYYGSYACYQLGEALNKDFTFSEAAKKAYQKACDGGHVVGCMMVLMAEENE